MLCNCITFANIIQPVCTKMDTIKNTYQGAISNEDWGLLVYGAMGDIEKLIYFSRRINQDGKTIVAVYPGVLELMKGIDISEMEFLCPIMDGALYLK